MDTDTKQREFCPEGHEMWQWGVWREGTNWTCDTCEESFMVLTDCEDDE